MNMFLQKILLIAAVLMVLPMSTAWAALNKTIMYIPHDNRPISFEQTADNVRALGFEVLTPPKVFLGSREKPEGYHDELVKWAKDNAKKADAAVISSDALVYGSLVASRKHELEPKEALQRVKVIDKIHKANKNMKLYVFGSIMRTPRTEADSGGLDDESFIRYVEDISAYTALLDKKEQTKLTRSEVKQLAEYEKTVPRDVLQKWLARRQANFSVNSALIDMVAQGDINYLVLGCDDNAKYSQTDRERRALDDKYKALNLSKLQYQSLSGIDEIGYVLLTRAVNEMYGKKPFVSVHYAEGVGGDTIPAASNEPIADTVAAQIQMAGGMAVKNDAAADLIFLVNTGFYGTTDAANAPSNVYEANEHIKDFAAMADKYIKEGRPVSIADITFGNGADNSLMQQLYEKKLLDRLNGYSGWNTPTNSTGYAAAMGISSLYTDRKGILSMLEVRYIDDWLYQSNVRQSVANEISRIHGDGDYLNTGTKTMVLEMSATQQLQELIKKYGLDKFAGQSYVKDVRVYFPWHRMYEASFLFPDKQQ